MRISLAEAREDWIRELYARGWQHARIRIAMFDYKPENDGSISYLPSPAWPTIADPNGLAIREDYERVKQVLLKQGIRFSRLGASSAQRPKNNCAPLELEPTVLLKQTVIDSIKQAMKLLHPRMVTQEQILRAAFVAQLPEEVALAIGTPRSAVHPERPTPSLYRHTGKKRCRARFDIGFGDVRKDLGITGVMELKAAQASFDNLKRKGELIAVNPDDLSQCKRKEPISIDIQKLLDPKLPDSAFRISWIALGRRGQSSTEEFVRQAVMIVKSSSRDLKQGEPTVRYDRSLGLLQFAWADGIEPLELAWYHPSALDPIRFESLWV